MPGEGGEPPIDPMTPGDDSGVADVAEYNEYETGSSGQGTTSGVGSLNLEVALLSIEAVDRIADAIARRAAAAVGQAGVAGVVLAGPDLMAALRLRAALLAEIGALEASVAAASEAPADDDAAAFGVPAAALALQGVKRAAQSASGALAVFGVTARYSGRNDTVRPATLDAALAKHLARRKVAVRLPLYAMPSVGRDGFIGRALTLQQQCRQAAATGSAGPETIAAGQAVDAITAAVFGWGGDRPADPSARLAQQLILADNVAAAGDAGFAVLSAELTVSGGNYRVRRWLFNFLTGGDGLTYNGGAAATFFLFGPDGRTALASDTFYFATPHGRFDGRSTRPRSTNVDLEEG